ncbi:putative intraflagellar transport protein 46 [Blattamonas nauphoetae]|uniref:Intraflagellar transport protein 46 n=1 Tax=Blattamonas nauphoetae TaxID=2049346 RepID=A0ABQ9X2U7_9EUKA|nr:putative intraflagellar transport protein 46 [Blattamonas nauphoetae]
MIPLSFLPARQVCRYIFNLFLHSFFRSDGEISMLAMNHHLSALNLTGDSFHNEEEEEEEEEIIRIAFNGPRSLLLPITEVHASCSLKPFIPEYQPTIGEVDSSVKVQRPDGVGDFLGLVVLDEHGPEQSNPSTLEM